MIARPPGKLPWQSFNYNLRAAERGCYRLCEQFYFGKPLASFPDAELRALVEAAVSGKARVPSQAMSLLRRELGVRRAKR